MSSPAFRSLRRAFLAGAIVLAPVAVTLYVLSWLIGFVGQPAREILMRVLPEQLYQARRPFWSIVSAILVLCLITLLGYLSRYVAGKFLLAQTESLMQRTPLVGAVYNTTKQIIATFSSDRRAVLEKVVLIPFPHPQTYAIGFLTSRSRSEMQDVTGEELWNIFVPTTPNPTSGFMILVPRRHVRELQMTIGEGMKLIISGGAVVPPWPAAAAEVPAEPATAGIAPAATASDPVGNAPDPEVERDVVPPRS